MIVGRAEAWADRVHSRAGDVEGDGIGRGTGDGPDHLKLLLGAEGRYGQVAVGHLDRLAQR